MSERTLRRTIGRVEAELRHAEALAEGLRELELLELELERYGDALDEDDRRRLLDLRELELAGSRASRRRARRRERELLEARA